MKARVIKHAARLDIRCRHNGGSDYRPLSRQGVRALLILAAQTPEEDWLTVTRIQIRLAMAIRGMYCPCPIGGEIARRGAEVRSLYLDTLRREPAALPKLTDRIYRLLSI